MRQAEIYARRCLQIAGILVHPPSVMPTPHLFSVAMFPTHRIPLQLLPRCAKDEKSAKTASRWRHFESRLSFEQERRRSTCDSRLASALVRFPYLGCACHVLSLHIFGLIIIIICIYNCFGLCKSRVECRKKGGNCRHPDHQSPTSTNSKSTFANLGHDHFRDLTDRRTFRFDEK